MNDNWAVFSNHGPSVDVIAPGPLVTSTSNLSDTAIGTFGGTSAAAAHVTGVAAKILEWRPWYTPADVMQHIINEAHVGKVQNVPAGTVNRLLFSNKWFYPFHSFAEWQNSDLPVSSGVWVWRDTPGWIWASDEQYPWFWRDQDQSWIQYLTGDPFLTFYNANTDQLDIYPYWWD